MMAFVQSLLSNFAGQLFYQFALKKAKRKAILIYLKTLQIARRSIMAAILVFICLQILVFGFLGVAITGIWLIPTEDTETKLFILLGFFGTLFLVPLIILLIVLSEKMWFRASGAEKLLDD